jgi:hypothetical protein
MSSKPPRTNTNARRNLPSWDRAYQCGVVARSLLAAALSTLLVGLTTPAQQPKDAPQGPVLTLQNLAPFARREGACVVVPFAAGAVQKVPDLHVPDTPTAWQPFGARWPDGSVRQALCLFETSVGPLAEVNLTLAAGSGPALPTGDVVLPAARMEFVARQGETTHRAIPERVGDLEHNALRRVELRRARLGDSGLVVELIVTAWRNQPHAAVDVAVFYSDPRTPAMQCNLDELAIETTGMALVLRHAGRLGVTQVTTEQGSRCVLLTGNAIGDGQGLRRTGALVPPLRGDGGVADATWKAACVVPLLGATSWRDSGAFGAFGYVPEPPMWLRGRALRDHLALRHRVFVAGDQPGGDPFGLGWHGLAKFAGQTGDQSDFGVVKMSLVAATGLPSMLLEVEASMLQEACRPVHFFEADGSPVEAARHPEWVVWSGRTHWHPDVSKDRLGKPVPEPPFEHHDWSGKDREHWSSNYLGAFALLSGSHWARAELENEARLYLAGQTLDPRLSTSHSGAARGAGRVQLAAAWNLLATGNEALRQRMNERIDQVYYREWAGREMPAGKVRAMCSCDPDPRLLMGKFPYWNPWQDALAAIGFGAAHLVTGNAHARELAEELAINVVRYGWRLTDRDCGVAMAMRWQDGEPFTAEQMTVDDPTLANWSDIGAYSVWSIGAVEIARQTALARGDKEINEKCLKIQHRMSETRRPPRNETPDFGGIDRLTEWDAVRWPPR